MSASFAQSGGRAASEWSTGWRPLVAGFVGMGVGWNFVNIVASLFLKPMQAELGWSRTELSFAPIAGLIVALLLPFSGRLLDRVGARAVAIAGFASISACFILFAATPPTKGFFFTCVILLGIAGAICNSVVLARGVAPWFERNLGLAVGLMMTGASVSAAIVVPVLAGIIADHGWRAGFIGLAAMTLVVGMPIILMWFREPHEDFVQSAAAGRRPRKDPMPQILGSLPFWQVAIGSGVAALPIGGFIGHLIPMLTDSGIPLATAAGFGSVFAVGIGVGRIANGFLLDRVHPPFVILSTLLLAAAGALILLVSGGPMAGWGTLAAGITLIGLAQGAEGDYIKFFSMKLFGLGNFARVVSLMAMTISLGMALGALVFAKVYDIAGTYRPAIVGSALLYAAAGIVFASIRMQTRFNQAQA